MDKSMILKHKFQKKSGTSYSTTCMHNTGEQNTINKLNKVLKPVQANPHIGIATVWTAKFHSFQPKNYSKIPSWRID